MAGGGVAVPEGTTTCMNRRLLPEFMPADLDYFGLNIAESGAVTSKTYVRPAKDTRALGNIGNPMDATPPGLRVLSTADYGPDPASPSSRLTKVDYVPVSPGSAAISDALCSLTNSPGLSDRHGELMEFIRVVSSTQCVGESGSAHVLGVTYSGRADVLAIKVYCRVARIADSAAPDWPSIVTQRFRDTCAEMESAGRRTSTDTFTSRLREVVLGSEHFSPMMVGLDVISGSELWKYKDYFIARSRDAVETLETCVRSSDHDGHRIRAVVHGLIDELSSREDVHFAGLALATTSTGETALQLYFGPVACPPVFDSPGTTEARCESDSAHERARRVGQIEYKGVPLHIYQGAVRGELWVSKWRADVVPEWVAEAIDLPCNTDVDISSQIRDYVTIHGDRLVGVR